MGDLLGQRPIAQTVPHQESITPECGRIQPHQSKPQSQGQNQDRPKSAIGFWKVHDGSWIER